MNKYQAFCQGLINGTIPFRKNYYTLNVDKSNGDNNGMEDSVKFISPTQSSVDKAKSEIEDEIDINMVDDLGLNQSGSGSSKSKRKKSTKKQPKTKTKKKTAKKTTKKTPKKSKNTKKKKRPIWM